MSHLFRIFLCGVAAVLLAEGSGLEGGDPIVQCAETEVKGKTIVVSPRDWYYLHMSVHVSM